MKFNVKSTIALAMAVVCCGTLSVSAGADVIACQETNMLDNTIMLNNYINDTLPTYLDTNGFSDEFEYS